MPAVIKMAKTSHHVLVIISALLIDELEEEYDDEDDLEDFFSNFFSNLSSLPAKDVVAPNVVIRKIASTII